MPKFRKKPVEIDAVQITASDYNPQLQWERRWDGLPFRLSYRDVSWLDDAVWSGVLVPHTRNGTDYAQWDIKTLEGVMTAGPGDWIIRGVKGELYPCKPDIFAAAYEPADAPAIPEKRPMNQLAAMIETVGLAYTRGHDARDYGIPAANHAHLQDMIRRGEAGLAAGTFSEAKLRRWLGYVQGVLVAQEVITLDEAKAINQRHADTAQTKES